MVNWIPEHCSIWLEWMMKLQIKGNQEPNFHVVMRRRVAEAAPPWPRQPSENLVTARGGFWWWGLCREWERLLRLKISMSQIILLGCPSFSNQILLSWKVTKISLRKIMCNNFDLIIRHQRGQLIICYYKLKLYKYVYGDDYQLYDLLLLHI